MRGGKIRSEDPEEPSTPSPTEATPIFSIVVVVAAPHDSRSSSFRIQVGLTLRAAAQRKAEEAAAAAKAGAAGGGK